MAINMPIIATIRRALQVRLRTLFVLVAILALFFAYVSARGRAAARQKDFIKRVSDAGGICDLEDEPHGEFVSSEPPCHSWRLFEQGMGLTRLLGNDFSLRVTSIYFLSNEDVYREILPELSQAPELRLLSLDCCDTFSGAEWNAISRCTNVEALLLQGKKISPIYPTCLPPRLRHLFLDDVLIDDRMVEQLGRLDNLNGLYLLYGSRFTPAQLERLKRLLPNCNIESTNS